MNFIHHTRPLKFAKFPDYSPTSVQITRRWQQATKSWAGITLLQLSRRNLILLSYRIVKVFARESSWCCTQGMSCNCCILIPFKTFLCSTSQGLKIHRKIWSNNPLQEYGREIEPWYYANFIWQSCSWRPVLHNNRQKLGKKSKDCNKWAIATIYLNGERKWERQFCTKVTPQLQQIEELDPMKLLGDEICYSMSSNTSISNSSLLIWGCYYVH